MRCRCTPKRRTWTAKRRNKAHVVERVFKALTDTFADPRGNQASDDDRRSRGDCGRPGSRTSIEVVEAFRRQGRSFLTPPPSVPLTSTTLVDVSHESLMRCWDRLIAWAEQEREAAAFYERALAGRDVACRRGSRPLAQSGTRTGARLEERERGRPPAWAARYDDNFARAMAFLDESTRAWEIAIAAEERARRQTLRRAQYAALVLGNHAGRGGRPGGDRPAGERAGGGEPSAGASRGRRVAVVGRPEQRARRSRYAGRRGTPAGAAVEGRALLRSVPVPGARQRRVATRPGDGPRAGSGTSTG